jgi:hypothetical protein
MVTAMREIVLLIIAYAGIGFLMFAAIRGNTV